MINVQIARDGDIAHVQLARPDKLNALTLDTLDSLIEAGRTLRADASLRAVVLSGQGDSFCAGLDFASVLPQKARVARSFVPSPWRGTNVFQEACWIWRRLPVPVVAAVHGHCFGGGLQIALGADLRFTTADAQWAVMESRWGLIPDMSGVQSLSELVGIDVAKRLTMTGAPIDGAEAVRIGLATEVASDPVAAATDFLAAVSQRSPDTIAAAKAIFEQTWKSSKRRTFARERFHQARMLASPNTVIARTAALRGETPRYRRRTSPLPLGK